MTSPPSPPPTATAHPGLTGLFTSLGQTLLVLDRDFRVLLATGGPPGDGITGTAAGELLGDGLFGPRGTLRRALEAGESREGWRTAYHRCGDGPELVALSAAPLAPSAVALMGDAGAAYAVVVRPVGSAPPSTLAAPTIFCGMAARSDAMRRVFRLVEDLRDSVTTVLITGESGTGKELVARAFHRTSPRRDGPFVAVNCAGLPEGLIESELFGHVRGAFTGAVSDRVGRFEMAAGGTLLLDEIGDLPPAVQVKLVRVLQERTFERVGESRSRRFDARILAATHVDLRRAIGEGRFRQDLYYRLRVVSCHLPPLRDRREDLEPLGAYLLARAAERRGHRWVLSPDALGVLLRYDWPGNVRELENAFEHAFAVGHEPVIEPEDLPPELLLAVSEAEVAAHRERTGGAAARAEAPTGPDPGVVQAALEAHRWRRRETAAALGISRTSLWRRMRELALL